MKKIIIFYLLLFNILLAKEELKINVFVGHDFYGQMKVDRSDVKDKFSNYNPNVKLVLAYNVYKHMDVTASVGYESYYMETYKGEYQLIPYTVGVRYISKKYGQNVPYMHLSFGANVLMGEEEFPIATRMGGDPERKGVNGFAEINIGNIYKDKYFMELAYKHHAFVYENAWPTFSSFWNGQILSLNLGYKIK